MKPITSPGTFFTALLLTCVLTQAKAQDPKVLQAFSKSYQFEVNKDYNNAIASLKAVYDSTSYEQNLRLGWLNYKAGFNTSSIRYYAKAVSLNSKSVEAKIGYNYPAYAIYNTESIIQDDKNILELDPNNTVVLYQLGYIYFYKNDFQTADAYFKRVLELYPFDYDALSMSAQVQTRMGNKKAAYDYLSKLLLFSPNDQTAKEEVDQLGLDVNENQKLMDAFAKSYAASIKNDHVTAIDALKQIYNRDSYEINLRLGYLHFLSGKHQESLGYYKIAISLKPKALEPHFGYVYPANALGMTDELIAHYKDILAIDPANAVANYRLGYLSYQKRDLATAETCFKKVVDLYPFSYDGLIMYAKTMFDSAKKPEATDLFKRVLLLSPADKEANAALTKLKQG